MYLLFFASCKYATINTLLYVLIPCRGACCWIWLAVRTHPECQTSIVVIMEKTGFLKCLLVQKLVPTLTVFSRLSQAGPFYHSVSVRLAPPPIPSALPSFHELQPESSHAFMNAFLDSQMFERFLEERTANPTQPEVRFFDESIAAKLNRSKTNPIKKDTPFLNDLSDAHNQASRGGGGGEGALVTSFLGLL